MIQAASERAGSADVRTERMAAPLRLESAADRVRFQQESFGALHQMLAGRPPQGRDEAWRGIESALGRVEAGGRLEGPSELLVAAGTR